MHAILLSVFLLGVTFIYWIAPQCIITKKNEYVMFFLLIGALCSLLYGIGYFCLSINNLHLLHFHSVFALPVVLFVAHFFYPFKTVEKNLRQHWNFFLFFAALLSVCVFVLLNFIVKNMN
jgi:hypothetical protein